jgi:hypothetical protein
MLVSIEFQRESPCEAQRGRRIIPHGAYLFSDIEKIVCIAEDVHYAGDHGLLEQEDYPEHGDL